MIRKGVLIVGASKGIGLTTARKFALMGYDIFGTYHSSSPADFDNIKTNCPDVTVKSFKLDVNSPAEIADVFNEVFKNHPCIEAVVFNSGISCGEKMLCDNTCNDIDQLLSVDLRGAILVNREASKFLLKQKHGSIVNVSSIYGIYGGSCEAVYSACKAGIIGLTKSLALELGNSNIRVNAVAPGYIQTAMTASYNEEEKNSIIESTPLRRLGRTDDVANAIYFLSSSESSFITGQIIEVSGGATIFS